jgi:hypothetical protein
VDQAFDALEVFADCVRLAAGACRR